MLASLVTLGLLMRLIWRLHGQLAGLVTVTFVAFDGWLLFAQRVSYIENTLMVIIVAGLLLYERACGGRRRGGRAGRGGARFAAAYKHRWLRAPSRAVQLADHARESRRHGCFGSAAAAAAGYLAVMIPLFDHGAGTGTCARR